jgi:transcriptional regulator with XRE-family HTH domain
MNHRIQQLRLARGFSLEELSAAMGGLVTKQALSKYEKGRSRPSARVLNRLAGALGTTAVNLWSEPAIRVRFLGYRKRSALGIKEQATVEAVVTQHIEARFHLQQLTSGDMDFSVPVNSMPAATAEDAEQAALKLREDWNLGLDPISDLTDVLEDQRIHVIEVDAPERFDGISGLASDSAGKPCAAAVVTRRGVPGDRQRLNLAHELGHLVLKPQQGADEEKLAFRFAGAFLAPAECLRKDVGGRRTAVRVDELLMMKARYKISLQAVLRRLVDLQIISQGYYKDSCIQINKRGWRKREPAPIQPEQSRWLKKTTLRCLSEGLITSEKAEALLGEKLDQHPLASLVQRREFLKLPLEDRRRLLQQHAEQVADQYRRDTSWKDIQEGDVLE